MSSNPDVTPSHTSRYSGGSGTNTPNPRISGYWLVTFGMPDYTRKNTSVKSRENHPEVPENWLTSTCKSFTPHTRTIKEGTFVGIGGLTSKYAVSQELGNNFTLEFTEFRDFNILNTFENWTSFFDPHTGSAAPYGKADSYKGSVVLYLMEPYIPNYKQLVLNLYKNKSIGFNYNLESSFFTGNTTALGIDFFKGVKTGDQMAGEEGRKVTPVHGVKKIIAYRNAWPTSDGIESLAEDITTNELISPSIQFSFDGSPIILNDKQSIDTYVSDVLSKNINFNSEVFNKTYLNLMSGNFNREEFIKATLGIDKDVSNIEAINRNLENLGHDLLTATSTDILPVNDVLYRVYQDPNKEGDFTNTAVEPSILSEITNRIIHFGGSIYGSDILN